MKINSDDCGLCEDCIDVCPEEAIKKKGYKIVIEKSCTNCKECVDVCPVGAIYDEKKE